jgi:hypothetical protein
MKEEIKITKNGEITLNRETGLFHVWDYIYSEVIYSTGNILDADRYLQEYIERLSRQGVSLNPWGVK